MKNLRPALFFSFDCGHQGCARPHMDEIRVTSSQSGKYFAADQCMQQIELDVHKK